jgi:hypothetical protein
METRKWALSQLPCMKSHALGESETPPCLKSTDGHVIKEIACPACVAMKDAIEHIKSEAYRDGYGYVAWVVTKGPDCELVVFGREPDEADLLAKYGDDLVAVVPV